MKISRIGQKLQFFTAGQAALKIGISVDTIRRWDKKGLVMAKRDHRNARIFSIDELVRIQSRLGGSEGSNRYKILQCKKNQTIQLLNYLREQEELP